MLFSSFIFLPLTLLGFYILKAAILYRCKGILILAKTNTFLKYVLLLII